MSILGIRSLFVSNGFGLGMGKMAFIVPSHINMTAFSYFRPDPFSISFFQPSLFVRQPLGFSRLIQIARLNALIFELDNMLMMQRLFAAKAFSTKSTSSSKKNHQVSTSQSAHSTKSTPHFNSEINALRLEPSSSATIFSSERSKSRKKKSRRSRRSEERAPGPESTRSAPKAAALKSAGKVTNRAQPIVAEASAERIPLIAAEKAANRVEPIVAEASNELLPVLMPADKASNMHGPIVAEASAELIPVDPIEDLPEMVNGVDVNIPNSVAYTRDAIPENVKANADKIMELRDRLEEKQPGFEIPEKYRCPVSFEAMAMPVFDASHPGAQNRLSDLRTKLHSGGEEAAQALDEHRNLRHTMDRVPEQHSSNCPCCRHAENKDTMRIDVGLQEETLKFLENAVSEKT